MTIRHPRFISTSRVDNPWPRALRQDALQQSEGDSAPCENSWLISLRQLYEGGANRQNTWWLAFDRMHCVLMGHSRRGNVSQLPDHGFMQRLGQRWICISSVTASYTATTVTLSVVVGSATNPITDPKLGQHRDGLIWNIFTTSNSTPSYLATIGDDSAVNPPTFFGEVSLPSPSQHVRFPKLQPPLIQPRPPTESRSRRRASVVQPLSVFRPNGSIPLGQISTWCRSQRLDKPRAAPCPQTQPRPLQARQRLRPVPARRLLVQAPRPLRLRALPPPSLLVSPPPRPQQAIPARLRPQRRLRPRPAPRRIINHYFDDFAMSTNRCNSDDYPAGCPGSGDYSEFRYRHSPILQHNSCARVHGSGPFARTLLSWEWR